MSARPSAWLAVPAAVAGVALAAAGAGIRLNLTGSIPPGLYRTADGAPARGAIVVACLPPNVAAFARSRGYLPPGDCPGGAWPVGKPAAAVAGDALDVGAAGIAVNGHPLPNSRALPADAAGRPTVSVPPGRRVVAVGELWLVSGYNVRSFDSRYFGPVAAAQVRAVVRPLWTAPRPPPSMTPNR